MPDKVGFFDDAFEQGKQIVKQTGQQVANLPNAAAQIAGNQVAPSLISTPQAASEVSENSPDSKKSQTSKTVNPPQNNSTILRGQFIKPKPEQVAKEQAELAKVRQELHADYYQKLVTPPKKQEEKAAQRVERQEEEEEQKKLVEQKKKEKTNAALANIRQGTGEKGDMGIGG